MTDKDTVKIIPCLDVKDGRIVKGVKFAGLKDAGDPLEAAAAYTAAGADELVFLDISAGAEGRSAASRIVRGLAETTELPITAGGGIQRIEDIEKLLEAGADKVSVNSAAVRQPEFIREAARRFGSGRIVAAVDAVRKEDGSYEVTIDGGHTMTGLDPAAWAEKLEALGAGSILLTSMQQDGTKSGYDNTLNARVSSRISVPLIASGGAGRLSDFYDAVREGGASGLLAASLFHFGEVKIPELKRYLRLRGIKTTESGTSRQGFCLKWEDLKQNESGLVPVIVQDFISHRVLMLAYMNEEAYKMTEEKGLMHYYSRSRRCLWQKGESSGHIQELFKAYYDCDKDTLLCLVKQHGAACHTGEKSCFYREL